MAARKTKKTQKKTASRSSDNNQPRPPDGFSDIGTPDIDAWLYPEEGTVVQGKIAGAFKVEDDRGERDILVVQLRDLQNGTLKMEGDEVDPEKGMIVAIGVSHKLRDALSYVEHKGELWAHYEDKKSIGHGQSMWKIRVACKGKRSAPPERTTESRADTGYDEDDVPF